MVSYCCHIIPHKSNVINFIFLNHVVFSMNKRTKKRQMTTFERDNYMAKMTNQLDYEVFSAIPLESMSDKYLKILTKKMKPRQGCNPL